MTWDIIGSMSNAIAAICAVVAIGVPVWNFRSDKKEQKKEKSNLKRSELYKKVIIDSMHYKHIPGNFERKIRMEWMKLESSVYECYIKEKFDRLANDIQ